MVRVRHSRQFHARAAGLVVLAALATGCKAGSWGTKPSWWSFGGTPSASALTAAPSFDKDNDVTKPSEAAKPYPTTNTPEGYALSDATKTDPARPAESQAVAVAPTAVTYGASPPPAAAQTPPAAPPAAVAQTSVGPQVGPYASLQPQSPAPPPATAIDPAGAATAGMAAAPAFGEAAPPMAQVPTARPPAGRYADASGQAWPPAAAPAAPAATGGPAPFPAGDDRYGVSTGSRFGGAPADFAPPPAGPPPTAPLEAPAVPPPAAPPITPAAPATVPATLAPAMTAPAVVPPPAAPGGVVLPGAITPPTRRADPGYRPGGTTNYRPSKTILAGEEAPAPGVLPASFEAPAAAE